MDQNGELSDDEKLAYLKSSMKDRTVSEMISPTTGEVHSCHTLLNLKEEYEDRREAHRGYLKALIEAKAHGITHADWLNLRITWDKHVSALKSVGCFTSLPALG